MVVSCGETDGWLDEMAAATIFAILTTPPRVSPSTPTVRPDSSGAFRPTMGDVDSSPHAALPKPIVIQP